MAFELIVEMRTPVRDLRARWQLELLAHGLHVEIFPGLEPDTWQGGFLPFKLEPLPDRYRFDMLGVVQLSGFEVDFSPGVAHFRSAAGRSIAELVLTCYGAACLAIITGGAYHDPQTGEAFEGRAAIDRAHWEILAYEPYMKHHARIQHPFIGWDAVG